MELQARPVPAVLEVQLQALAPPDLQPIHVILLSLMVLCSCDVVVCSALPVTARSLEALIRLSQAHAKLHLADRVEAIDVQAASR